MAARKSRQCCMDANTRHSLRVELQGCCKLEENLGNMVRIDVALRGYDNVVDPLAMEVQKDFFSKGADSCGDWVRGNHHFGRRARAWKEICILWRAKTNIDAFDVIYEVTGQLIE